MEKNEIRAESIHFKDVKFRSSKELRDRLKTMPVFRDEYTVSDPAYPSAKECEQEVFLGGGTVSYTHLDVYKRQTGDSLESHRSAYSRCINIHATKIGIRIQ